MERIKNIYTSVACNKTPGCADFGANNLVIYGACNSVTILDPFYKKTSSKILKTFVGHTKRVNCVKWINSEEFVSGADDGLVIHWRLLDTNEYLHKSEVLKGHEQGVTYVDGIYVGQVLTVVSTSCDSSVKLWRNGTVLSSINLKTGLVFAVRLVQLPRNDKLLLICGNDESKIQLYTENNNNEFILSNVLLGHEDWIRGIDAIHLNDDELFIATASQDSFIRLWNIKTRDRNKKIVVLGKTLNANEDLETEEILFDVESQTYSVSLDSVLQAHENWVYGVHMIKNPVNNEIQLLSSSMDKTLILWNFSSKLGVWEEKLRVGDVGGNSLGFYGGKFSANGESIIAHGYMGGLYLWKLTDKGANRWTASVINGGHYSEVNDICWERKGDFLLSVSNDQTTRCHSYWKTDVETWHEIARPQIHGYDIQCLAALSRYKFASGAEEKIIRTFQAPINFIENFQKLTLTEMDEEGRDILSSNQTGAAVPSLGLSNKGVTSTTYENNDDFDKYFVPLDLKHPPLEENLMQNTLWPEIQKLYGHGNGIYTIASNHDGTLLASACKSSVADQAQIILWNTTTWKILQTLPGHNLTVTQIKFSHDDNYLLSVSRDRRWSLYQKSSEGVFELLDQSPLKGNTHSRIIWTCDWSHNSKYFITGSRDGKAIAWKRNESGENGIKFEASAILNLKNESITALAFYPRFINKDESRYLVAVGFDSGDIRLYYLTDSEWIEIGKVNESFSHQLCVTKLAFRPFSDDSTTIHLASSGKDHLVRINEIILS